jgi:hypothetical protein
VFGVTKKADLIEMLETRAVFLSAAMVLEKMMRRLVE